MEPARLRMRVLLLASGLLALLKNNSRSMVHNHKTFSGFTLQSTGGGAATPPAVRRRCSTASRRGRFSSQATRATSENGSSKTPDTGASALSGSSVLAGAAVPAEGEPEAAVAATPTKVSRGGAVVIAAQLALQAGAAILLYNALTAEDNPLYRSKVQDTIAAAVPTGNLRVLEVGIGAAPNLECYPPGTKLIGLDAYIPERETRQGVALRASRLGLSVTWVKGDVQELPFKPDTFDAVIVTKVLCSVEDPAAALREISRVLKPGGRFGYVEHVAAEPGSLLEQQQLLIDPLQQSIAGNCHLHRDSDGLIRNSVRGVGAGDALFERLEGAERYEVWQMWPIAQQAAGLAIK